MAQTEDPAERAGGLCHFNGKSEKRLRCVQNSAKGAVAENGGGDKQRRGRTRSGAQRTAKAHNIFGVVKGRGNKNGGNGGLRGVSG